MRRLGTVAGDALLGREMGRYRIESIIGSGGFATVYRAIDLALERPIALKVVDPAAHRNPTIGRRFVLEGRAVASLDHPAIVPVYDAGENDGVLWMAMRLIAGGSLDDALVAGRRFTFEQVAAVVARIGDALDHAHGHGIVHRDVKPSNILLEQNDPARAWLADFGIAATTRTAGRYTTGALGTAAYMAPEQARPSSVGPPADLYSLGCVAYELLTRRRPFPGDDYVELLLAHASHPVPPTVWPRVDAFLQRALAKDPSARPASGAAFAGELRRALVETERARRPAPPPQPSPRRPPPPSSPAPPKAEAGAPETGAPAPAGRPPAPPAPVPATGAAAPAGTAAAAAVLPPPPPVPPADDPATRGAAARAPAASTPEAEAPAAGTPAADDASAASTRPPAPAPHRPGDPVGAAAPPRATGNDGTAPRPAAEPAVETNAEPVLPPPPPPPPRSEPERAATRAKDTPAASATDAAVKQQRDEMPTVVEHVDKTLEHPQLRLPPPPVGPPPGRAGPGHRPPPPGASGGGLRPPPPRDPTVVRTGRRRGRQRLIAGAVLLVIGIVAGTVALLEQRGGQGGDQHVDDPAGISYDVPDSWSLGAVQGPEVLFERDGAQVATIVHGPAADGRSAADQLDDATPEVCEARAIEGPSIEGADEVAKCGNTSADLPLLALGAVAQGQFWVITVSRATPETERDAFLQSIELSALNRDAG